MESIMAELGSITAGMMEKQEDTITRLTAELAKSERVAKFWEDELIGSKNAINGLLAELAEAKKDTARLDFLDETDQSFYWPEDQPVRAVIDAAKGE